MVMMQQVDISARIQTARVLGLSIDELLTIYRVQFPVMRQHEADTWYDQTGRIVFTPSKGLIGVGLPPTARKANLKAGIHYAIRPPESELLGCGEETALKSPAPRPRDNLPGGPCPAHRRIPRPRHPPRPRAGLPVGMGLLSTGPK